MLHMNSYFTEQYEYVITMKGDKNWQISDRTLRFDTPQMLWKKFQMLSPDIVSNSLKNADSGLNGL